MPRDVISNFSQITSVNGSPGHISPLQKVFHSGIESQTFTLNLRHKITLTENI